MSSSTENINVKRFQYIWNKFQKYSEKKYFEIYWSILTSSFWDQIIPHIAKFPIFILRIYWIYWEYIDKILTFIEFLLTIYWGILNIYTSIYSTLKYWEYRIYLENSEYKHWKNIEIYLKYWVYIDNILTFIECLLTIYWGILNIFASIYLTLNIANTGNIPNINIENTLKYIEYIENIL